MAVGNVGLIKGHMPSLEQIVKGPANSLLKLTLHFIPHNIHKRGQLILQILSSLLTLENYTNFGSFLILLLGKDVRCNDYSILIPLTSRKQFNCP